MKFKVGDKVRVRKDLKRGFGFGIYVNHFMELLKGKVVTISRVREGVYEINESGCYWSEDLFEQIEFTKDNLENGDKVTTRDNQILIYLNNRLKKIGDEDIYFPTSDLNDNLTEKENKDWDIVKVERPTYEIVYERDEDRIEMTIEEVEEKYGIKIVGGNK